MEDVPGAVSRLGLLDLEEKSGCGEVDLLPRLSCGCCCAAAAATAAEEDEEDEEEEEVAATGPPAAAEEEDEEDGAAAAAEEDEEEAASAAGSSGWERRAPRSTSCCLSIGERSRKWRISKTCSFYGIPFNYDSKKLNSVFLTQKGAADIFRYLVARLGLGEVAELLVEHALELQRKQKDHY